MLKVQEIREIIKLIDESTISEFTYETNETKVVLKKDQATVASPVSSQDQVVTDQSVEVQEKQKVAVQAQAVDEKEVVITDQPTTNSSLTVDYDYEIVSPMVGTLYSAPSPEEDPYVANGAQVTKDTVVCIVEAMKLFNEIVADVSGEIVEVLVEDGELVEYGQPLFRVKTK
ncbi:MAG TPA: acetyl-CoA carboxylase biotin carboxyl carrier protein [Virgibacillus sp.]|nr:acetyl-CoA carboxylase biotin carboxyl carrier protein [Virgibacillus sp.]